MSLPMRTLVMPEPPAEPADDCSNEAPDSAPVANPLRSEDLLRGRREVIIEHGSEIYRLRLTRNGKLILQK